MSTLGQLHFWSSWHKQGACIQSSLFFHLELTTNISLSIPAEYAVMPIYKSLYTRIAPDASDLLNSTFSSEMTEMAHVLRNLAPPDTASASPAAGNSNTPSLIIIDELGRGSSVADGLSISLAITDELVRRHYQSAMVTVFMCTHFPELPKLIGQRPGVSTLRMKVNVSFAFPLFSLFSQSKAVQCEASPKG